MSENGKTTVGDFLDTRREGEMRKAGIPADGSGSEQVEGKDASVDDNFVIEMKDGSKLTVRELKDGHLRQSDYSKKTSELAKERKAYEESQKAYEARKKELEEFVTQMDHYYNEKPEAYNEVVKYFKDSNGEEIPVTDKSKDAREAQEQNHKYEYDKKISALQKELDAVKQQQVSDKTQLSVDKAIAQFTSAHPELNRESIDEVLAVAQANVVPEKSPEELIDNAYKIWDYENLSKTRRTSQEQQRVQKVGAQYFGGGDKGGLKRKSDGEQLIDAIFTKRPENIL